MHTIWCGLVLALAASSCSFALGGLRPVLSIWDTELTGSLGGGGGRGHLRKSDDTSFGASLNLHFLGYNATFEYRPLAYSAWVDVQSAFLFDNRAFGVGEQVLLDFDWNSFDWNFRFFKLGEKTLRMDLIAGLQIADIRVDLRSVTTGVRADVDETLPLPYLGGKTEFRVNERMHLGGDIRYFNLDISGNSVEYLEADVSLRVSLARSSDSLGSFIMGYRRRELDAVFDDGRADEGRINLDIDGPYAALRWQF